MHDGFGDLVCDAFADDVKVGGDKTTDELCFQGFSLREVRGRGSFGDRGLPGGVSIFMIWT